jgi:hypothetical protein
MLGLPTTPQGDGMGILNKQQTIRYFTRLSFLYDFALPFQTREILAESQVPNEAV